ncbi:H-2 class II histocompatibility antigen gamma chain isoform X2 [Latimeria chalumnae]|uniref:H-2 class II histocompatibility antigen gamma chain isoform X2 n=1 Tax=Latimeria chalumnae TaxID=7897 RepID=UPI0003C154A3|nr:PREDICTED: HLA class II histocompatibility antigen gamma chain isoform X2 [Latimeria chalumnae]|eukprot:XP_005988348.1 PREDICTED: HLA class II histocompatibility antigen gamma chain isoform X2 [Latimeria chalumnae]
MTDERQDLLRGNEPSLSESVVNINNEGRSTKRTILWTGLSIFVALLIAGQAVTVYFVMQQKGQITTLEQHSKNLELTLRMKTFPKPKAPRMMMPMAIPLAYSEDVDPKKVTKDSKETKMTPLENTAVTTQVDIMGQVLEMLQKQNPQLAFPNMTGNFLENLNGLKEQMQKPNWQEFESWLQHWFLFQLVQKQSQPQSVAPTTAVQEIHTKTKCEEEAATTDPKVYPGRYSPQCDELGNYKPMQCWYSTNYCWCVDKNGTEIEGTRTRGKKPDCRKRNGMEEMVFSGVKMLPLEPAA